MIALDNDTYKPNAWTPEDIERELGELPETTVVETGRGGLQFLYAYPEDANDLRNGIPENELGPGICVKSDGGYALCPPSVTEGTYRVLQKHPLAPAPKWLVEALRKPSETAQGNVGNVARINIGTALDGPEIRDGERNWTLYRIGSRLRAQGLDRGEILEELDRVNANRCSPPVDTDELEKIAASAARHAPGNASPEVSPEVLEALDAEEADIMRRDWPGMGGKSERDVMIVLVRLARLHGTTIPAGVRAGVDIRTLALMAGVSKRALLDNRKNGKRVPGIISRLKARGWVRSDNAGRRGKEAGALVLLPTRARLHHSTTGLVLRTEEVACGATLRAPLTAPRLRWSRPVFDGPERVGTISRLGKSKGEIIDHLERAGGTLKVGELADALAGDSEAGKRPRVRDLRRRHLDPLEAAGVVECSRDTVSFTADWLDALNERRDLDGEIADHRRDLARYEREREAYRNRDKLPADEAPTADEMRERRESYPDRRRAAIGEAIAGLFAARPEYHRRRVGQVTCALHDFLPPDYPRGPDGYPKDSEVEAILDGESVAA